MTLIIPSLSIIYQDEWMLVISKPSGLLAVPGRGPEHQDCVVNRVKSVLPACIGQPAVHRLDMDTSGLMILALTPEAHRRLSIAFEQRLVSKTYEALLDGVLHKQHGVITLKTRLDPFNRPRQVVDAVHGKTGITRWENLEVEGSYTRIRFYPRTGRTHQLRLHAAHPDGLGIPIAGDRIYGSGTVPGELRLHASQIALSHPVTEEPLSFSSAPPF